MEIRILDFIQKSKTGAGDLILPFITSLGNAGIVWIVFTLVLLVVKKTRRIGLVLCTALIINAVVCNIILKPTVARIRPFDVNTAVELIIKKPNDYSFPSGHTSASFTCTTGLFMFRQKKFWIPALVLSVLIAFSRMYLYVHYPTDILGGIAVGIFAGLVSWFIFKNIWKKSSLAEFQ